MEIAKKQKSLCQKVKQDMDNVNKKCSDKSRFNRIIFTTNKLPLINLSILETTLMFFELQCNQRPSTHEIVHKQLLPLASAGCHTLCCLQLSAASSPTLLCQQLLVMRVAARLIMTVLWHQGHRHFISIDTVLNSTLWKN